MAIVPRLTGEVGGIEGDGKTGEWGGLLLEFAGKKALLRRDYFAPFANTSTLVEYPSRSTSFLSRVDSLPYLRFFFSTTSSRCFVFLPVAGLKPALWIDRHGCGCPVE